MLTNLQEFVKRKRKLLYYIYLVPLVIIFTYSLSTSFFGFHIGFYTTEAESAKYLLSTLIQSEAAILAIVITLSLVAVQQTASSYSPRVIEVFKDKKSNPDFYLLMGIYLISILYEMWVLKQINNNSFENIKNFDNSLFDSFEAHIWISYAFGVFSFLSLVPYIQNTLDLLKPLNIIEKISENISQETVESFVSTRLEITENISKIISQKKTESFFETSIPENNLLFDEKSIGESESKKSRVSSFHHQTNSKDLLTVDESLRFDRNSDDNPIQQIFDSLVSSQIKYDFTTSKYGLLKLIDCIESSTEGNISLRFYPEIVKSFTNLAKLSLFIEVFGSSLYVIRYLENIGVKAVEQKIKPVVDIVLKSLNDISIVATEQRNEDIAILAASSIRNIGIKTFKKDLITKVSNEGPYNAFVTGIEINLRFIGKKAAELKLEKETLFVVQFLTDIGRESINNKLIFETRQSVKYLEEIGRLAIRQELEEPITIIGVLLDELGVTALKLDPGKNASQQKLDEFETLIAVSSTFIGNFGKLAAEQNFEYAAKDAVITLKKIGIHIANQGFKIGTTVSLVAIKGIGIILVKQGIDHAVETVILSLREIGEISIENNMNDQAIKALSLIDEIGDFSVRKNMGNSIKSIVLSFNSFGKIAIQKNMGNIVNGIVISIERIGITGAEQKMDFVAKNSINILKNIAELSIESKNENAVIKSIQSIEDIGKLSVTKRLENSIEYAALSIKEIGFKAIVKKINQVVYQSQLSLENIVSSATDIKLSDNSSILESLEELNDNIKIYDI